MAVAMHGPIRAELARTLVRPSSLLVITCFSLLTGGLALAASEEHVLYLTVAYLYLPLALVPFAAHRIARDDVSHLNEILGASPLRRRTQILTRLGVLMGIWVSAVALTLPITWLLLAASGEAGIWVHSHFIAWGALTGTAAIGAGTFLGVACRSPTAAVPAGFGVSILWFTLAESAETILAIGERVGVEGLLRGVIHISPLTWAFNDVGHWMHGLRLIVPSGAAMLLIGVQAAGLMAAACAMYCLVQEPAGWKPTLHGIAIISLVLGISLLSPSITAGDMTHTVDRTDSDQGFDPRNGLMVDFEGISRAREAGRTPFRDGESVTMTLDLRGRPYQQVALESVGIHGDSIALVPTFPLPQAVLLDSEGAGEFRGAMVVQLSYAAGGTPITIELQVDGIQMVLRSVLYAPPAGASGAAISLATIVPLAGLGMAAAFAWRRESSWP